MANAREPAPLNPDSDQFEDRVFSILGNPLRRKMLMSLARESSQQASNLHTTRYPHQISNVVKHLIIMRKAGFVTMAENPADGRRALYSLSPAIAAVVSESKVTFNFSLPSMTAEVSIGVPSSSTKGPWNEELVFSTLADRARRRLLLALARGGPQPVVNLQGASGRNLDDTLKRLASMRAAGWVTMSDNPKDGRRSLYALSPEVPITTDGKARVIDFGFCVLRVE